MLVSLVPVRPKSSRRYWSTVRVGSTWAPVDKIGTTFSQLAVLAGTKKIQVELTATGDVQIDDLYVDPFFQDC